VSVRTLRRGTMAGRGAAPPYVPTPPEFRASAAVNLFGNQADYPLTVPAAVEVGDLMIAQMVTAFVSGWAHGVVEGGWTILRSDFTSSHDMRTIFYRFATEDDVGGAAVYTFRMYNGVITSPGSDRGCVLMVAYAGVHQGVPVNVHNQATAVSTTTSTAPAVTTTVDDCRIVRLYSGRHTSTVLMSMTGPATQRQQAANTEGRAAMVASEDPAPLATAGDTGTAAATGSHTSSSCRYRATTLALRPYMPPTGVATGLYLPGVAGNYISTPDTVANSITEDIDIRAKLTLPDWTPAASFFVVSKYGGASQRSYSFRYNTTGSLSFTRSTLTGSSTSAATSNMQSNSLGAEAVTGFADGSTHWVRVAYDRTNGTNTVWSFYTSDDYDPVTETGTWTQLGAQILTSVQGTIFNGTAPVEIGSINNDGGVNALTVATVHYVEIRNGIGGTIVNKFDPAGLAVYGAREPVGLDPGGPWTIHGSAWDWAA
jgi:hypothetical protein